MDKRRRLLGLKSRNATGNKEDQVAKAKPSSSSEKNAGDVKGDSTKEEFQNLQAQSVTPKKYDSTPKRRKSVTSTKEDSPSPSFHGPGIQSMFPRTLGSPEIEVSWDWGCSQIPKDMLPLRRSKRTSQSQPPPVVSPVITSCPRIPFGWHMSEEEHQERLAFYKNILSNSLKVVQEETLVDSTNNNLEKDISPDITNIRTTPKKSNKSILESRKKEQEINTYFDDSANEFMLECSQAIEEQLKNGVIDMGPIVNIEMPHKKHAHSPVGETEHALKRVCHTRSKSNLFPEVINHVDTSRQNSLGKKGRFSFKSSRSKQSDTNPDSNNSHSNYSTIIVVCENDDDDISMQPTQPNEELALKDTSAVSTTNLGSNYLNDRCSGEMKQTTDCLTKLQLNVKCESGHSSRTVCNTLTQSTHGLVGKKPVQVNDHLAVNNNIVNGGNNNIFTKRINSYTEEIKRKNDNNYSVNKSLTLQNINPVNNNQELSKFQTECNAVTKKTSVHISNHSLKEISSVDHKEDFKGPQTKMTNNTQVEQLGTVDITSLLDDGLDLELCNLDFDSLCSNGNSKEAKVQPKLKTAPEMCSQQQIEAKRLAALNRLMMKKNRK